MARRLRASFGGDPAGRAAKIWEPAARLNVRAVGPTEEGEGAIVVKAQRLLPTVVLGVLSFVATAQSANHPPTEERGIHRSVLVDHTTVQAARVTYEAGAIESAGVHPYDVVLVPLNRGVIKLNIPGQPDPNWQPGTAIFIKRGTEHRLANVGSKPIEFIVIRVP